MNEHAEPRPIHIVQLFSLRGLAFLAIVLPTCYIIWGQHVVMLLACGVIVGLVSAALGVLSSPNKAFQVSMRGLLLLMLIIAFLAFWQQHFLISSDAAVARIKSLGGKADIEKMGDGRLESDAHFIDQPIQARHLNYLRSLPNLTHLDLDYCQVSDDGMWYVGKLMDLTRLDIEDTATTDEGLTYLVTLQKLTYLIADGNDITDQGLLHLAKLKSLRNLRMRNTKITPRGIEKLNQLLPNCNVIVD